MTDREPSSQELAERLASQVMREDQEPSFPISPVSKANNRASQVPLRHAANTTDSIPDYAIGTDEPFRVVSGEFFYDHSHEVSPTLRPVAIVEHTPLEDPELMGS